MADMKKVYTVVKEITRFWEIETVFELEKLGLFRICIKNGIDPDKLTDEEKEIVWKELRNVAREQEFKAFYEKLYLDYI